VPEQHHGPLSRRLEAGQGDRAVGQLDGEDLPAVGALLLDPALLAHAHQWTHGRRSDPSVSPRASASP